MKAVWFEKFGKARDVLIYGEQEIIEPGPGEVLVKLATSAINPSDVKKRMGSSTSLLDEGYVIPNSDGAGIVEAVGEGVQSERIGERVWVYNGQYSRRFGTSAEYITLPEELTVYLPDEASFEVGACMGIPAMTAHRCVTTNGDIKDKYIFVTGGAGRVGHYAVQWAKHFGAKVIASAGSGKSQRHCIEAGADLVVPHPSAKSNQAILDYTGGEKIDLVVEGDMGANLPFIIDVMKTGGIIATYASMTVPEPVLPFYKMMYLDLTIRLVIVYAIPLKAKLQAEVDITQMLQENKFIHRIAETYQLADAATAHESVERGNNYGAVLLNI